MSEPQDEPQLPVPSAHASSEPENPLSMKSMAKDAGRDIVDGVKDEVAGWVFTGLIYVSIFLAVILPVAGLIVGGLFLWLSIASGRSKFLPIMTIIASIVFWIWTKSPLGMLPLIMDVLR